MVCASWVGTTLLKAGCGLRPRLRASYRTRGKRAGYQLSGCQTFRSPGNLAALVVFPLASRLADRSFQLPAHCSSLNVLPHLVILRPAVKIRFRDRVDQWTDDWWMKDASRSTNFKPVGNELAGNCGIALRLNGTVVCHQNTVEDRITAERNSLAGSDNVEQNLIPLHSDQVDMRIAA
jgi:hypothetical protein